MYRHTKIWIAAATCFTGLGAVLLWSGDTQAEAAIPFTDQARVSDGQRIYTSHCAACHGAQLEGQSNWQQRQANGLLPAPPHDETGHTWHHADDLLFKLTKYGPKSLAGPDYQTAMPGFEGVLADAEVWSVLAYIKAQWPVAIQQRHTEAFN